MQLEEAFLRMIIEELKRRGIEPKDLD